MANLTRAAVLYLGATLASAAGCGDDEGSSTESPEVVLQPYGAPPMPPQPPPEPEPEPEPETDTEPETQVDEALDPESVEVDDDGERDSESEPGPRAQTEGNSEVLPSSQAAAYGAPPGELEGL